MTESPQQFGTDAALVGVLTQPAASGPAPGVAVLLFNAGVIPRMGPHRLNVKLARALAAQGLVVLRFDLSGQGDSRNAAAVADFVKQGVLDLKAAMDHIEASLGIRRFALIGICSGAVSAYWAGATDARVTALMMFDGFWYRTRWTKWVRDWKRFRAAAPATAWAALRRRFSSSAWALSTSVVETDINPPSREFSNTLQALVDRGTAVAILYSGSVIDYYSYQGQLRQHFAGARWLAKVQCSLRPDIDHTFLSLSSQQRMVDLVLKWSAEVLGASAPRT
jgi:pimeloyl-ACP methyl ester carboxylesterase